MIWLFCCDDGDDCYYYFSLNDDVKKKSVDGVIWNSMKKDDYDSFSLILSFASRKKRRNLMNWLRKMWKMNESVRQVSTVEKKKKKKKGHTALVRRD